MGRRSDLDGDMLQRSVGGRVRLKHLETALAERVPLDLITGCRYPAAHFTNGAQQGSLQVNVPVTCLIESQDRCLTVTHR